MQTLFFIGIFIVLVGLFVQNYFQLAADAEASPTDLSFGEWLKHSWLEIVLNLGCFAALCFGIDIGLADKASLIAADGDASNAFLIMISAAIATATGIKKLVQFTLLPMFSLIFKSKSARNLLREKVVQAKR